MKLSELGVGKITKQNATKDAPIGSEYSNVKKLGLGSGKPKLHNKKATRNTTPNKLFNLGITEDAAVLYHATYKPFLDSIMKNGLGGSGAQTQWEDSKPGYVYLAKDPEVAVSHAEANEEVPDEYIDDIIVIAVDASKLDLEKLEDDTNVQDDDSTLAYNGIIPSAAFSVQIDERGSIGVPLSSGLVASVFPHRPLKIKKSTPGKLNYNEAITSVDLDQLETFADKLFAKVGIDVEFTRHFLDRVNDARNVKPITMAELTRLFKQEFKRYGKPIAQMGPGQEAVMKDLQTDINLPFALQYDRANNELDLIAKTVMRKKDFKTPDREFPVEGWSAKYKKSINCSNPKGFSQKAHCAGKKKNEDDDSKDSLGSLINFPGFEKKEKQKKPKYKKIPNKEKGMLDKIKSWFTDDINEGYVLRLENDEDLLVLHIRNTNTGERAEVRGNPNYEIDYDADDELHQLLDVIGKASNISELMNGKIVSVNPKHPDGPKSYAALDDAMNESIDKDLDDVADWMDTTPDKLNIDIVQEPIEKFVKQIREMYDSYDEFPEDAKRTNRIIKVLNAGEKAMPIYVAKGDPDLFVMEGRHRMVAFWQLGMKTIPVAYVSVKQSVDDAMNEDDASDKVYELLLDNIGAGPFDGGCVVVAQALQKIHGGELMALVRNDGTADHAVVQKGNTMYDFDGPGTQEEVVSRFEKNEGTRIAEVRKLRMTDLPDAPRNSELAKQIASFMKEPVQEAQVDEGVNDPHIFKAVFMAGGPGSGKGFVAKNILGGTGLRVVNSDDMFEYLMKKRDLALEPDVIATPQGQEIRQRAKTLIKSREQQYLDGRIGLIIDGTGKEPERIQTQANKLRELGYDCAMILVNTSLPVAQQRNKDRERTVPAELVTDLWNKVQENLMKYQQIFGAGRFHIIDNSGGLEDLDRQKNFDKVYVETQRFLNTPPSKPAAKKWIQQQKEQNDGQRSAKQPTTNQEPDGGTTASN